MMFKEANIDCYFVFKGGDGDIEKHFLKHTSKNELYENYTPGRKTFIHPLYVREIIEEVLDDLKFIHVSCEYEAKNTCIALAQTLSCPIISLDRDYVMSNIDYIPYRMKYHKLICINGVIKCGVFNLENFLKSNNITMDHYTLFLVLMDDSIFPEDYFSRFFTKISSPKTANERNKYLLSWLSKQDIHSVIDQIVKLNFDKKQLLDALSNVKDKLYRKINGNLSSQHILSNIEIDEMDPEWFEKGVILRLVDVSYVNMYRSKIVMASDKI